MPGPNVALIAANSLKYGYRTGLVTVFGTTAGVAVQLALVVGGLVAFIEIVASALVWIRWLGVAYLIFIGIRAWREPASDYTDLGDCSQIRTFSHGFVLAVLNPKTLIFNAAFLPQFVSDQQPVALQLGLLSLVFLLVVAIGDSCWALFASSARHWLLRTGRWRNRFTGGVLIAAATGLAMSSK